MRKLQEQNLFSVFLVIIFLLFQLTVFAQTKKDTVATVNPFADTTIVSLTKRGEQLAHIALTLKTVLAKSIDTTDISENIPLVEKTLSNIDNSIKNNQRIINLRSLNIVKSILSTQQNKIEKWQMAVDKYTAQLSMIQTELNKLINDSTLKFVPADPDLQIAYKKQKQVFITKWKKSDSLVSNSLSGFNLLQNKIASLMAYNADLLDEAIVKINNFTKTLWKPEEKPIWSASSKDYQENFSKALSISYNISLKVFLFYLGTNLSSIIYSILFLLLLVLWIKYVIKIAFKKNNNTSILSSEASIIISRPFNACFLMLTSLIPFFVEDIPASGVFLIWTFITIVYTSTFYRHEQIKLKTSWLLLLILFYFFLFSNILSHSTLVERWLHLLICIFALFVGYKLCRYIFSAKNHFPLLSKYIIVLFLVLILLAFLLNIIGCFTLAKLLSNSATMALITARILFTVVDLFVETIYLHYEAFKQTSKFVSYFDFYNIKQNVLRFLHFIVIIVWLIILIRNLSLFDFIYSEFQLLLTKERVIGNFSFSFGSILIFVIVIWISSIVSKALLITFGGLNATSGKKNKFGSTVLLLRLGVLSAGILLAFAASGIPMDKLTIIIGALGVGIGFGLQNIVNNLVSGVILAFEKPIQVGDAVEVSNRFGTVKEIGIRSSKLTTVEGSDVIVPNGDLLSHHIINWTLSSQFRRVEIIIGVGYNSDLRLVENILNNVLLKIEGIEKHPAPIVLAHNFSESSVDFRLLFWSDMDAWIKVKSNVLINVFEEFKQRNIEIPFPQRDVHIKNGQ